MPQGKKKRKPPTKEARARRKKKNKKKQKATPIPRTSQNYRDGSWIPQGVSKNWWKLRNLEPPKEKT